MKFQGNILAMIGMRRACLTCRCRSIALAWPLQYCMLVSCLVLLSVSASGARAESASAQHATPSSGPQKTEADPTVAIPALIEGLRSSQASIRRNAAFMLGQMGQDAAAAINHIAEALRNDPDGEVRRNAAFALGEIGAAAIPVLMDCLNDTDARVRRNVTAALVRIGVPAVPPLIKALDSSNPIIRRNAASMLGRIGPQAHEAIPHLERALGDSDRAFCWTVKEALRSIRSNATDTPAVSRAEKSPVPSVKVATVPVSSVLDTAKSNIPQLVQRLHDTRPSVRRESAFALARIGEPALPALINALQSDQATLRRNAAFSLGEMGAAAAPAVPALEQLLNDSSQNVRWCADIAIKKINNASQQ